MDAVTYPNRKVTDYCMERLVPLRLDHEAKPQAEEFLVKWTPRLLLLDSEGKSHQDQLGFFFPQELLPFLDLGQAKYLFNKDRLDEAIDLFDNLIKQSPASGSAPEAVFLRGVARFKRTHDPAPLKEVNRILSRDYPGSQWSSRGFPYWNL